MSVKNDPPEARDAPDLLEILGAIAREEKAQEPDSIWDQVAEGTLDEAALAEAELDLRPAFSPLGDAFQERVTSAALDALASEPDAGNVIPFRRTPLGRSLTFVLPILAAAALVFLVVRPGPIQVSTLPAYTVSITGGEKVVRGADTTTQIAQLVPGSRLGLILTPTTRIDTKVEVKAWLAQGSTVRPWPISPQIPPAGGVLIEGTFESLGLAEFKPGDWQVIIGIGAVGTVPDSPEPSKAWQRLETSIRLSSASRGE